MVLPGISQTKSLLAARGHRGVFRRIILTFLFAIILPSALLGYFGIYAIEREKLVLKSGIEENHLRFANFVHAQLKHEILLREGKVRRDVNLFLPSQYQPAEVARVMDRLRMVHKIVGESFLLTDDRQLLYPRQVAPTRTSEPAADGPAAAKERLSQDRYAVIKDFFLPELVSAFDNPDAASQTGRHLTAQVEGEKVTVMFFFPFEVGIVEGRVVRYIYGCILNTDYVRELASKLVGGGRFEEDLVVAVTADDKVMAVSPGAPADFVASLRQKGEFLSARRRFTGILPHWEISVYYLGMTRLNKLINRRLISHIVTVMLLVVVIVFGVVLSLRNISRELELARMKSDFVSNVSHELKTPLTSIRMFAEMLKTGRVRDARKQQEYYELMTAESERLSRLINNVLDFARVEEGRKQYNFVPLDAGELMDEAAQIIQPHVAQKGFEMHLEPSTLPLPVTGDRDSLEQVLLNILNNAVKYSGEVKEIRMRAYDRDREAIIEIEDKGIGIAQADLPRIFDKFYRADPRPGYESSGTGLGLTLAMQIVKAHNGRINVRSEPGKGSTFSVVLPLRREQV